MATRDVYQLLRIDEALETVRGDQRFSTLDLRVCYRQVELAPENMDKSALVTRQGLFRSQRMPFGLANVPGTLERLMEGVLRDPLWMCCLVYFDDIVVYSRGGFERHMVDLGWSSVVAPTLVCHWNCPSAHSLRNESNI